MISSIAFCQQVNTVISYETELDNPGNRFIFYQPAQPVFIADFKGHPEAGSDAVAITNSGFMFKMGYRSAGGNETLNIKVFCSFDKEKSWMKENGKTDYILQHEQLHFDISYLSTLLFINKLKGTKFTTQKYQSQIRDVYDAAVNTLEQLQNLYDTETRNGQVKEKQQAWTAKIKMQLHSLAVN